MKFTAHINRPTFIFTSIILLFFLAIILGLIWVFFLMPRAREVKPLLWWVLILLFAFFLFILGRASYLLIRGGVYEITNKSLIVKLPLLVKRFEIRLDNIEEVKTINRKELRASKEKWRGYSKTPFIGLFFPINLVEIRFKEPQVIYFSAPGAGSIFGLYLPFGKKEGIRISVDQREKFIDSLKKAIQSPGSS